MKQHVAFITGASHGIGRAIAEEFARKGWSLAINCRSSKQELLSLASDLKEQYHISCLPLIGDAGNEAFISRSFEQIHQELGPVSILVNNAGISYIGLLSDMTLEEWNQVINTNLTSAFCCCKHAIPDMVHAKSGAILNISSVWGNIGEIGRASCRERV